ncbi:MAG TPA: peptide-methionine (R)-S-oxide reductase [Roseibacterium sp.]|nr:peptide-methionine (R)-S-oxide reductase [Roseibacterium sp.]
MKHHTSHATSRRVFLGTAAASALVAPVLTQAAAAHTEASGSEDITYEVTRTDEEWRALLSEDEFGILRGFGTEPRYSSPLWEEDAPGHYHCKGCDLSIYDSEWKTVRFIGWVFFYHARPDSVLLGIDEWPAVMAGDEDMAESQFVVEAHCRRCGSHLGHMIRVQGDLLHCINGASLNFTEGEAS